MQTLEKLFGGAARVKLMRLFLFNPTVTFQSGEVADRAKITPDRARKELAVLRSIGMVRKIARGKSRASWRLNEKFTYLGEMQRLLLQTSLMKPEALIKKLTGVGRLKVVVLAGLFKEQWDDRLDILIVADVTKRARIDNLMKVMEAEIGKEIRYAVLDVADFKYRLGISDKLVRDVLDYPHDVILDRLGILPVV